MDPRIQEIICEDGVRLGGHWWPAGKSHSEGVVVINPATGVLARYYHRYAAFLAEHGFDVLTYDYRGIGLSRPADLKSLSSDWRCWGEKDFEAALGLALERADGRPVSVVGHSIGGFLPGFARSARHIHRMLTVGAQHAYWRDYRAGCRLRLLVKWHVVMPVATVFRGYFPGKRLGWLEDLPAGVAYGWSFGGREIDRRLCPSERQSLRARFAALAAPILAIAASDDEFATREAMERALGYYANAEATKVILEPDDIGAERIGHFALFHDRHRADFWLDTLLWLRDGINPWPSRVIE